MYTAPHTCMSLENLLLKLYRLRFLSKSVILVFLLVCDLYLLEPHGHRMEILGIYI